jgi:hypothetical protein
MHFSVSGGLEFAMLLVMSALLIRGAPLLERLKLPLRLSVGPLPIKPAVRPSELEIVIIALCALPLMAFALSLFVTGSFSARYMAAGALLPAIAVPYVLDKLPSGRAVALALVPLILGIFLFRAHAPDPIADALTMTYSPICPRS